MTYVFTCPECGYRVETPVRDPAPRCKASAKHYTALPMKRDWKAEAVNVDRGAFR